MEEESSRSSRPRREKRDHKTEKENIQSREPKIDEVIPQYLAEALEVAKPWAEEENKQTDGKKDMERSEKSKEDEEQQKEDETEDESRYSTPRAKLDIYGNVFLSMESAEDEQSEDMIKEPPDKKPPINRPKVPPRRTKLKGKDGQHGSEELYCGCHDCILALLKHEG